MSKKYSSVLIILAGCLWGTLGIFVRKFSAYGITSMSIVFIRSLLTAVCVMGVTALARPSLLKFRLKDIWIFAGMGLFSIVLFNFCYFRAVMLMSLSAAAILLYTSPVFVMLLSALIFKEKISLRKIVSIFFSIAGLVLVTGFIGDTKTVSAEGLICGLLSAIGYALYSIFTRSAINRGYGSVTITGWAFFFAAVFSVFAADLGAISSMFSENTAMLGYSVAFAVCASVMPFMLYSAGLKGTENSTAAVLASAEPVAATIFGMVFFGEIPSPEAFVGIIIVIAAMLLSAERKKNVEKV
ncbi:MAG: DMT family transporter [Oscillospiraceae bacterium]